MSINFLTSEVLKRDVASERKEAGVGGFDPEELLDGRPRFQVRSGGAPAAATLSQLNGEAADRDNMVTGSLNLLVKYIPTEVITLYVATLSAAPALQEVFPRIRTGDIYWGFTIITPLLLLLIYINKRATSGLTPVPPARQWPWWKLFAATVAFMVWALAVPGNPYVSGSTAAVLAGLGAVFISMLLNLLEPIFEHSL
ncbi:MAG TPA: hypothetical protein VK879_00235 [Candidatus Sulfomarinibacteraceae bacterium]|nr:hypothetical protein [Candidatus Sulfomarinibacteraceae bacterium]